MGSTAFSTSETIFQNKQQQSSGTIHHFVVTLLALEPSRDFTESSPHYSRYTDLAEYALHIPSSGRSFTDLDDLVSMFISIPYAADVNILLRLTSNLAEEKEKQTEYSQLDRFPTKGTREFKDHPLLDGCRRLGLLVSPETRT